MKSTLSLFNSLPVDSCFKPSKDSEIIPSKNLLTECLKYGIIFDQNILKQYPEEKLIEILKDTGITPEQLNSTFHKSWKKIANAPIEQLIIEQMMHYITTYGFEALGIYKSESVYIPNEELDVKEFYDDISLRLIKGLTEEDLKDKVLSLLKSGIALKDETMNDIIDIISMVGISEPEIETITNKEVKCSLYSYLSKYPSNNIEFLRYLIYKITGYTLLIKSNSLIDLIKDSKPEQDFNTISNLEILNLIEKYEKNIGLENLAKIFYRYKPLFLAMRQINKGIKIKINRIRRLAKKYHQPMNEDYLNNITTYISHGQKISGKKLQQELDKSTIFRKIRLAYALQYRTNPEVESILYNIRNGKSWATEFSITEKESERAKKILDLVLSNIQENVKKSIDKLYQEINENTESEEEKRPVKIFLPNHIKYALPSTEKQFCGNIPQGSCVEFEHDEDSIFGIYWEDDTRRIDLDLSSIDVNNQKTGWDASYRKGQNILFSGDMTEAKNGANEYIKVDSMDETDLLICLNFFNADGNPAKYDLIIGKEKEDISNNNSKIINPDNVIFRTELEITRQQIIGVVKSNFETFRYFIGGFTVGSAMTASSKPYVINAKNFLFEKYSNPIFLNDVLENIENVEFVKTSEDSDINLSIKNLEKDSILNLIKYE